MRKGKVTSIMPLMNSEEEFVKFVENKRGEESESVIYFADSNKPKEYPCWLVCLFNGFNGYWDISFVYKTELGEWDLERYENGE